MWLDSFKGGGAFRKENCQCKSEERPSFFFLFSERIPKRKKKQDKKKKEKERKKK